MFQSLGLLLLFYHVMLFVSGVYELMHRMGYSWLAPRPLHRHADAEAQEAFKEYAPLS